MIMFLYKQKNICVSVLSHVSLRKSTPAIGVKFLRFFTFFMYENINQEYNLLCQTLPLDLPSDFSVFVLNLSKSGNILFRKMPSGKCLLSAQDHCH